MTTQEAIENIAKASAEYRAAREKEEQVSKVHWEARQAESNARAALSAAQWALLELIDQEVVGYETPEMHRHRTLTEVRSAA